MRTLSSTLLAAQRSASAQPHVEVVVENSVAGVRRLDFAQLDATAQTIAKHDVAVAADGSVTRVRIESGTLKQQRVTNPASGSWTAWNNLVTSVGTVVACAAAGTRVAVIYVNAAGTGIKLRESTDSGATYAAEVAVATAAAAVVDLAVAYKNTSGDLAIAWVTATGVNIIKRTSGAFGAAAGLTPAVSSLNGIAMTYGFDWDIVLTGAEATTLRPSVWTLIYGDGNDAPLNTWGALDPQQQAEPDAQVTFKAPSLTFVDTYRINFVEADAFTGGATRVYRTAVHPAMTFASGPYTLRTPAPVNYGGAEGLALAADAGGTGFVYESAPDAVYRAPHTQVVLSLTSDVLAIDVHEDGDALRGHVDVANAGGAYAGPPPPIAHGNLVGVSWGYRTTAGLEVSRMADLWIAGHEHRRTGGVSVLRIFVEGGWELLRRNRQRTQIVHTADTYATILIRICARAGLQLSGSGSSSRASSVTPKFTIHPSASGFESVQQALAFLADRIRMRAAAGATITEPLTSAATDYTFGTNHPLREVRLSSRTTGISEVHALGASAFGEAIDFASAVIGAGTRAQMRDLTSTTGSAAAATATAHLRQRALDRAAGEIVVPPNCGQELLDVVEFTDAYVAAAGVKRRVAAIHWRYDRARAVYEQRIALGEM